VLHSLANGWGLPVSSQIGVDQTPPPPPSGPRLPLDFACRMMCSSCACPMWAPPPSLGCVPTQPAGAVGCGARHLLLHDASLPSHDPSAGTAGRSLAAAPCC
jgi:hypothetical protein